MKLLLTAVFLIPLAGGADAFELQRLKSAELPAAPAEIAMPLSAAKADKYAGSEVQEAYKDIEHEFHFGKSSVNGWEVAGEWEGRVFSRDAGGNWRSHTMNISFRKTVTPADLGPLFQNSTTELYVSFPYYATHIEGRLSKDGDRMKLLFRADRTHELVFRRFSRGGAEYLSLRTDIFEKESYAYFYRKAAAGKSFTGGYHAAEFSDWAKLRAAFFSAEAPAGLEELVGGYSGYLHPLYEREDHTVDFKMSIFKDPATGAVKAAFPFYDAAPEIVTLEMTPYGASFKDAWGGRLKLLIRKNDGRLYLFSDLYSDETYGTCSAAVR